MMKNIRAFAAKLLSDMEEHGSYSSLTLTAALKRENLNAADAGLASRLFYGVLERQITLDYYIAKLSDKKPKKLEPLVRNILRVGLYQLKYLSKIPKSAAVNECVNAAKLLNYQYSAGFINAVLREFIREEPPLPTDNSLYALSVRYSCPTGLLTNLIAYLGQNDALLFLKDALSVPPTYIRVNPLKADEPTLLRELCANGISAERCPLDGALSIRNAGDIASCEAFISGKFHVQDLASQLLIKTLDPKPQEKVLDVCAAPGGKSCTAAEYMKNRGLVLSCELYEHRLKLISENAERLSLEIVKGLKNDGTVYNDALGTFDKILCDVPCSGFGVIRRKPEIRYKNLKELTNLPELQYNILNISANYLKDGGLLMYSTCTLSEAENEQVVDRFLSEHAEFSKVLTTVDGETSFYHRLLPQKLGCDGFFFALFKKGRC